MHIFDFMADTICDYDETVILCQSVLFLFGGYSCQHMNASRLPVYISNNPAGTSIWDLQHWAQVGLEKLFWFVFYFVLFCFVFLSFERLSVRSSLNEIPHLLYQPTLLGNFLFT